MVPVGSASSKTDILLTPRNSTGLPDASRIERPLTEKCLPEAPLPPPVPFPLVLPFPFPFPFALALALAFLALALLFLLGVKLGLILGSPVALGLSVALGPSEGILPRQQRHAAAHGGGSADEAKEAPPRRDGAQVPGDGIEHSRLHRRLLPDDELLPSGPPRSAGSILRSAGVTSRSPRHAAGVCCDTGECEGARGGEPLEGARAAATRGVSHHAPPGVYAAS